MLEYVYIVKCPNCEDEHFYFFDEAKSCAMGQLTKKPIITQVEVNRNDFGECTDSCDLGTVWSWEDMMKTDDEPEQTTFTKASTVDCDDYFNQEFDDLDNSLEVPEPRKPVPADMTIDELVEAMEENEDEVECTWCNELFDKSECRKEVSLGWLCDRCQAAIMSRGEPLTFKENNYWDFLDESVEATTWVCLFDGKELGTVTATNEQEAYEKMEKTWPELQYNMYDGVAVVEPVEDSINESMDPHDLVELEYPSLTVTLYGPQRDVDDWDEVEHTTSHVFLVPKVEVATAVWENWITEEDVVDVEGGLETLEDDTAWEKYLETHFDDLFEKYHQQILDYFKDEAVEDFRERSQEEHDLERWAGKSKIHNWNEDDDSWDAVEESVSQKPFLEEFDDAEAHKARLTDCPECGATSYDMKEQYCANCGLNL